MALFFRFDKSKLLERDHVLFHPFNLGPAHASALNIDGDSRKVGRRCLSLFRGRIAIVPPQLFLNQHGANRGIHLNLAVKFVVIIGTEIIQEVAGPGTAVAPFGIESGINSKGLPRNDWDELFARYQFFELLIVLNSWQIEPVNFLILADQRIVRGAEQRIPKHSAKAGMMRAMRASRRNVTMQPESLSAHREGEQKNDPGRSVIYALHEVVQLFPIF